MAMKFLAFHDQLVANFSPDDQEDNFLSLYTGHAGHLPAVRNPPEDWDATA
jgi:hypothetical protein